MKTKKKIKSIIRRLSNTRMSVMFSFMNQVAVFFQVCFLKMKWLLTRKRKPTQDEIRFVKENVTFIYKSFERQKMAKRLYRNIQSYYPGVRVVIADDSFKPLKLADENLELIQLPFNSGLSIGLNCALKKVTTPFVIRMDDDELLTPYTRFHDQLEFLMAHKEIDLVGILLFHLPQYIDLQKAALEYYKQPMSNAPKKLKIPHMTCIDETHIVVGKAPNTFIARTEKIREVGYDNNIRMIDHNEFFYRASGNIVSVLDPTCFVLHYHNQFDRHYQYYRTDIKDDLQYIRTKMKGNKREYGTCHNYF